MREEETKTHPSYGLVQFSRVNGKQNFFGSDNQPDSYIELTISKAEERVDLVRSWYYPCERLVKVRMTNNQFAELITSLNMGSGVPCTLEFIQGKIEQEQEKEYKVDFHKRKTADLFQSILKNVKADALSLEPIINKLPKKDQEEVKGFVSSVVRELEKNMPFFMECFYEQMEKVALDIKINLEADITHKLTTMGLDGFNQKQLNDTTE